MPFLEWKDSLSVGIRSIDEQHQRLLAMVNEMHDAAEKTGLHCPAPELIERLKAFAAEHFHVEEGYMQAFGYPDYEAHLKEHEDFNAKVAAFESACTVDRAGPSEIMEYLKGWLTKHFTGTDLRMGRFLEDYLR